MKLNRFAVLGFLALPLIGFLLPKHTQASAPTQVAVVNRPTVQVGNTPNVNVSNTPNVNVANQVGIASLPSIEIAGGSVNATVAGPVLASSYADLYPVELSGGCVFPSGSGQCTQDGFYTVPAGYNATITDYYGGCTINSAADTTAQLFAQWGGMTQTFTTGITNSTNGFLSLWGTTGARFYAAAGTSVTVVVNSNAPDSGQDNCVYTITGYLVPTSASSPNLGVKGAPRRK